MEGENQLTMENMVALMKSRGFVYPSSDIYGGYAGVYDFGPMGTELSHNLKTQWWKDMVQTRPDIVGLNSAIFMSPKVWEASGHVGGFSDPMVSCKECQKRSRADHLLDEVGINADEKMPQEEIDKLFKTSASMISCPQCGKKNFSDVEKFNLLVESNLGNFTGDSEEKSYLRGETAQGIYVNYKNVIDTMHIRLPFGIAQIGKAFRNEITPRQFIFRTREFEQMEMQYFVHPDSAEAQFETFKEKRLEWLVSIGLDRDKLRMTQHENLVFYAKDAYDIEYNYPFGWKEVEGVHARGEYDLTVHAKYSGVDLTYTDPKTNEKFTPNVVETSIGIGRLFMAVIFDAYREEEVNGDTRVVLGFDKKIAPVKIAILPLSNKEELMIGAKKVFGMLSADYMCQYDHTQSIGKRYRRQDEIGTPYCVTFDFDSLEDNKVTVRDRDTMEQDRVKTDDLADYFKEKFSN